MNNNQPVAIFFFAHQDDEFGVFQAILDERSRGRLPICVYLTSGVPVDAPPDQRNWESTMVLDDLGVENILFMGAQLRIADGYLSSSLDLTGAWLENWLKSFSDVQSIYLPAWEGGHPDHDALHVLVLQIALEQGQLSKLRQYSLYNALRCPWQFFKTLAPLPENGPLISKKISFKKRFRFLGYLFCYRSQIKTWIGLFPFVLLHYLFRGTQDLQAVVPGRVYQRPHEGRLYYEKRRFSTWNVFSGETFTWIASRK